MRSKQQLDETAAVLPCTRASSVRIWGYCTFVALLFFLCWQTAIERKRWERKEERKEKRLAKKKSAVRSLSAFAFALQMLNDAVLLKFVAEQSFILYRSFFWLLIFSLCPFLLPLLLSALFFPFDLPLTLLALFQRSLVCSFSSSNASVRTTLAWDRLSLRRNRVCVCEQVQRRKCSVVSQSPVLWLFLTAHHSAEQRNVTQRNTMAKGEKESLFLIHFVALCSCLLQLLLASTCSKDTRTAGEREERRREESAHSAPFLLLLLLL